MRVPVQPEHLPPRPEAREHPDQGRRVQDLGLRLRQVHGGGAQGLAREGHHGRHAHLHVAAGAARRALQPQVRRVVAGRDLLQAALRAHPLRRHQRPREVHEEPGGARGLPALAARARRGAPDHRRHALLRRGAALVHPQRARRAGPRQQRQAHPHGGRVVTCT